MRKHTNSNPKRSSEPAEFLSGGGEMGKLIRDFNWAGTSLGPLVSWPQSLLTTLGIVLKSKFPMVLLWGESYTFFYNDAYRPTLGNDNKHPRVLGIPGAKVWEESWQVVKPLIDKIFYEGESILLEDQRIPIFRNGRNEVVYWTFSYSPVTDESNKNAGVFITCLESTEKIARLETFEENSRSLNMAMEIAELGMFKVDLSTNRAVYSQHIMELFGLSEQNLPLPEIFEKIHPEDRAKVTDIIERTISGEGEGKHDIVYKVVNPLNDETKFLHSIGQVVFSDGKPVAISGIVQDVSKEIFSKKILEEREKAFRDLVMGAPVAIVVFRGSDFVAEIVNDAYLTLIDKTREEFVGQPLFSVLPETKEILEPVARKALHSKQPQTINELELKLFRNKKEEVCWFNTVWTPYYERSGNPDGLTVVVHEVTDQVLARKRIEESEARFRSIADQSPMFVFIIEPDEDAKMSYFNKKWLDYTGKNFEEAIGKGWNGVVHPDDVPIVKETYKAAFQKQNPYTIPAIRIKRYDGQYRWHMFKANPRYLSNEKFIGYVGVGIDVDEQQLAHEQLELNNNQLKRINNDLDNFIYTASHDLKAPMSNIEGLLYVLRSNLHKKYEALFPETEKIINMMEQSVNRFKATILDLTEISKAQREQEEDVKEVDINEIIDDVKLSIQDKITESNARIEVDLSQISKINFSKKNIKSIIYNLLSNAIKYRDEHRRPYISFKTKDTNNYVLLIVKDNGLGIPANNQEKIFNMFKRFHDHVEGSGIGLYIVKRIIDNAGGKIEVESEVGKGTTFKIYFAKNAFPSI